MEKLEKTSICKRLYFDFDDSECLIFADANDICQYNFITQKETVLYDFNDFET